MDYISGTCYLINFHEISGNFPWNPVKLKFNEFMLDKFLNNVVKVMELNDICEIAGNIQNIVAKNALIWSNICLFSFLTKLLTFGHVIEA